jgi:hypothetical protein
MKDKPRHGSAHTPGGEFSAVRRPVNRGQARFPAPQLICDSNGTPIYVLTSGANVSDIGRAVDLLDGYPPIAGRPGRPRHRLDTLLAAKGYSSEAFRRACRARHRPIIPQPKTVGIKRPGQAELRRRTDPRAAAPVPSPGRALGTPPRHPRQRGQSRLRHDRLASLDQMDRTKEYVRSFINRVFPRSARLGDGLSCGSRR